MAIEDRIKIIPIHQVFLKQLTIYYLDKFKFRLPDFSKTLIVFPSERNKLYFRRYLLDASNSRGVITPTLFTVEEFINYIYEKLGGERGRLLIDIERNFLLKQTIDRLKIEFWHDLPFLKFISIGNRLINFFDELAQDGVDIGTIEKKSIELHFSEKFVKNELAILRRIYEDYRKTLSENGYRDEIDKIETINQKFTTVIFNEFEYLIIAGLAATTALEKKIISKIMNELPAELILHSGTPEEIKESKDTTKRFYLHHQLLNYLNVDLSGIEMIGNIKTPPPVIHIKSFESISKQIFYLQDIVSRVIKKYQYPHRIGIVLTDEALLFPIIEVLKSANVEYNLSAGLPFTNLIFYSFLKSLLNALKSNFHYQEFFIFISHPLIKNGVIDQLVLRPLVYQLKEYMVNNRMSYFKWEIPEEREEISGLGNNMKVFLDFLKYTFDVAGSDLTLNDYIDALIQMLNRVLSYNQEVIKSNFPGTSEFFDRLYNLARLRINDGIKPGIERLEFILRILEGENYRLMGKPFRGVQVIGVLEARNLDFDCLIMPSMNEGIFPRKSEKDMFINQPLRKAVGLLTHQERDTLYYYYFTQLTQGRREVYLFYINEEKKDIPSRFIIHLKSKGYPEDTTPVQFSRRALCTGIRSVKKSPELLRILKKKLAGRGRNEGLSHSTLTLYRKCPYRFYLAYILRIEEVAEIVEEPDAVICGNVIHEVIREFYRRHYPDGITDEDLEEATRIIFKLLDDKLRDNRFLADPPKPLTHFEAMVWKGFLREFLNREVERFKDGYKILIRTLEEFEHYDFKIDNNLVHIKGFIDRVDVLDNKYYIIDYKTGRIPGKRDYTPGETFIEFQLPLYALIFTKEKFDNIGNLIYYKIGRKADLKEICAEETVVTYLEEFKEKILIPTIREILNPDIPFSQTTNKEFCATCNYINLCGERTYGET